jgi:probable HAF family extracellular repeat protein
MLSLASSASAQRYTIQFLGTLPNGTNPPNSRANAINNNGFVGGQSRFPGGNDAAFYDNPNVPGFPTEPIRLGENRFSTINSINNNNVAVGGGDILVNGSSLGQAMYYDGTNPPQALQPLSTTTAGNPRLATANGINDNGVIVGFGQNLNSAGTSTVNRAVFWSNATATPTVLQGLLADGAATATAINNGGQIVGNSIVDTANNRRWVVRWSGPVANPTLTDISGLAATLGFTRPDGTPLGVTIDNTGNFTHSATSINDDGFITGTIRYTSESNNRGFVYNAAQNRFVDFGIDPGFRLSTTPFALSVAQDINNNGTVVGWFNGASGDEAFVLDGTSLINLNQAGVIEQTSLAASGFLQIQQARSINDSGQIVGVGSFGAGNGVGAFLLTPFVAVAAPEPGSFALLTLVGVPGIIVIRKRKAA